MTRADIDASVAATYVAVEVWRETFLSPYAAAWAAVAASIEVYAPALNALGRLYEEQRTAPERDVLILREIGMRETAIVDERSRAQHAAVAAIHPMIGSRMTMTFVYPDSSLDKKLGVGFKAGQRAAEIQFRLVDIYRSVRRSGSKSWVWIWTASRFKSKATRDRAEAWNQGFRSRWHELRRDDSDYLPGRIGEHIEVPEPLVIPAETQVTHASD